MGHQRTLHLERPYAVAGALDDVVGTSHKPVVSVFVTPCQVAGVIETVVPGLLRQLVVAVIALEQAYRLAVAGVYAYLAFLTILTFRAVGFEQMDVVLRVRLAHASGFGSIHGKVPRVIVVSVCPKPSCIFSPVSS